MAQITEHASTKHAPDSAKHGDAASARADKAAEAARGGRTGAVERGDRRAWGRSRRKQVPFSVHGEWVPSAGRPDPVSLLEAQGKSRVQDLLPIRYGRMAESPFGFFRGAAAVMAADLAGTPNTGISVQLSGDAHLMNFGAFGTPERRLIFDVNDFDETLPGPWEWDLQRLGASFAVAARAKSLSKKDAKNAVACVASSYANTLRRLSSIETLDAWYWSIDTDVFKMVMSPSGHAKTLRRADKAMARAHAHDRLQAVDKLTEVVDGKRRIVDQLPLVGHVPGDDEMDRISALFAGYRESLPDYRRHLLDRFQLIDAARKVVGVGSVGTRCWIALLDGGGDDDPLLLQVKEADGVSPRSAPPALRVREPRPPGRRRPAAHAGRQRPVPRLDPQSRARPRLLLATTARHEGLRRHQPRPLEDVPQVRRALRHGPGPCSRTLG